MTEVEGKENAELKQQQKDSLGITISCKNCEELLLDQRDVFFYDQHAQGIHFCLKPELVTKHLEVLPGVEYFKDNNEERPDSEESESKANPGFMDKHKPLLMKNQANEKRKSYAAHSFVCSNCETRIGDICPNGPKKDFVCCFTLPALKIVRSDGVELDKAKKWETTRPFLSQIVEVRSILTFYGLDKLDYIEEFTMAPLTLFKPNHQILQSLSLKELCLDKPRSYQIECFIHAALQNSIVYLPTGAGKTLVASMMTALMHKLNPFKTVVFVVHRVSLAFQQGQYIKDQTGLQVLIACGETAEEIAKDTKIKGNHVIVITAQVLINWIQRKKFRLEDCSLLILDEVHNAVKAHPFVIVMKEYYAKVEEKFRPLFLGLTASPTYGEVVKMQLALEELCTTCMSNVYLPCIYWNDMMEKINRPLINFSVIEETEEMKQMTQSIVSFCQYLLDRLEVVLKVESKLIFPGIENLNGARGFIRLLTDKSNQESNTEGCHLAHTLSQVFSAVEINSVLGPKHARLYLSETLNTALHKKESWMNEQDRVKVKEFSALIAPMDSCSNKVQELLRILLSCSEEEALKSRAIIFVQTKRTARQLFALLKSNEEAYNRWLPAIFVGQSAGQVDGMPYLDDQAPTLTRFRLGQHRLLISTNVLQEGMDVPICNRVILFDQSWTLTSFIQSRGRARAAESAYNLICCQEEKTKYELLIRTEKSMEDTIMRAMFVNNTLSICTAMLILLINTQTQSMLDWPTSRRSSSSIGENGRNLAMARKFSKNIKIISLKLYNLPPSIMPEIITDLLEDGPFINQKFISHDIDLIFGSSMLEVNLEVNSMIPMKIHDWYTQFSKILESFEKVFYPLVSFRLVGVPRAPCNDMYLAVADTFDVGNMLEPNVFFPSCSVTNQIKLGVSFPQSVIRGFFLASDKRVFRFDVDFSIIDSFILVDIEGSKVSVAIPLTCQPFLFYAHTEDMIDVKLTNMDRLAWERSSTEEFNDFINMNGAAVIKFDLFLKGLDKEEFLAVMQRLKKSDGLEVVYGPIELFDDSNPNSLKILSDEAITASVDYFSENFELVYILKSLFSSCFRTTSCRITPTFFDILNMIPDEKQVSQIKKLAVKCGQSRFVDLDVAMMEIVRSGDWASLEEQATSPNTCPVRFVTVTPSRIIYELPKDMMRNRILRSFNPDYFLRVQFRDEDGLKLSSVKSEASLKNLLLRVERLLEDGIKIGNRHYTFLAMSASQLRDHGCWFVAPHQAQDGSWVDADRIRAWCGNFSAIKNVAKYVARLGQSLSASYDTVTVPSYDFEMIPDITVTSKKAATEEFKEYTFTDGIGMISPALAREVAERLQLDPLPSAFQIRFAGFKGVVAINPIIDPGSSEKKMWLRKSMKKFDSQHYVLEVLNTTQVIPAFLNRQVLMILSGLGVPDEVFSRLQDEMFNRMASMLLNSQDGLQFLSQNYYVLPNLPFSRISQKVVDPSIEPFFRSLIFSAYKRQLAELLTRSRIFLPRGRILMGTIDEMGLLEEGQVFVQITKVPTDPADGSENYLYDESRNLTTILGDVTIAKNPCMHPGDVRKLKAVNIPQLRRTHFDCIVFPAKGSRPITDMCSGSDLDGDLYFVTWDPNLSPPIDYPPMEYDAPKAVEVGTVTLDHIKRFMVDFIANDQLGTIANAHVAHVDRRPAGVKEDICVLLAYIFSMAVDFPKTGYVPEFPKDARVIEWPDFMQKTGQPSYDSPKIMGRLFRKAKTIFFSSSLATATKIQTNPKFLLPGHEAFLERSEQLYHEYADALAVILGVYSIDEESQLFAGALTEAGSLKKDDLRTAIDVVKKKVKALQDSIRNAFEREPGDALLKASAWYAVAYGNPYKPGGLKSPVLSFPWIVGEHLLQIAEDNPSLNEYDLTNSIPVTVGHDMINTTRAFLSEDYISSFMERIQFKGLLESNINARLQSEGKPPMSSFEQIGSCSTGVFFRSSDINIMTTSPLNDVISAVTDMFQITVQSNQIIHRGKPFSFTISSSDGKDHSAQVSYVRSAITSEPLLLAFLVPIQRWARAQGIVRKSIFQSGQISATLLSSILVKFAEKQAFFTIKSALTEPMTAEQEYNWITSLQQSLDAIATGNVEIIGNAGNLLFDFVKFMGFSDEAEILALVHSSHCHEPVGSELIMSFRGHFFKAFHILSQSLSVSSLWTVIASAEVEQEVQLAAKRPNLFKRLGPSSAVFMEGASVLLFEGSRSDLDPIGFDLYQLRRRPQHVSAQCFSPILREPDQFLALDTGSRTYNDYFIHAVRQFEMAKRVGSASDHGNLKMTIKFGRLYLTNLPKMFLEEGLSATVENTRKALALGYKSIGQKSRLFADKDDMSSSGQFKLEPMRMLDEEEDSKGEGKSKVLTPADIIKKAEEADGTEAELKSMKARIRKKSNLTPMSSSFEPHVLSDSGVRDFIQRFGFRSEAMLSGYAVSLTLFNATTEANSDYQVIYDEAMKFVRLSDRPIKWMVIDMKTADPTESNDMRLALTSRRDHELPEDDQDEMIKSIRKGIVQTLQNDNNDPEELPGQQQKDIEVTEKFRDSERLFVRHSHQEKFIPTPATLPAILQACPTLNLSSPMKTLLTDSLRLRVTWVTEYTEHDKATGRFPPANVQEKVEVELDMVVDWDQLAQQPGRIQECAVLLYHLGYLVKPYTQATQDS